MRRRTRLNILIVESRWLWNSPRPFLPSCPLTKFQPENLKDSKIIASIFTRCSNWVAFHFLCFWTSSDRIYWVKQTVVEFFNNACQNFDQTQKSSWLHLLSENAKALFCIVFKLPKIVVNNGKKLGQNTKNELRIV